MEETMPRGNDIIRPDTLKLIADLAEVNGGSGQDILHAKLAWLDTHFHAGGDDDLVIGGDGNDTIWGQDGSDNLLGGRGNDTIYGDDGTETGIDLNDWIIGGFGADTMFGSLGADTFYWNSISETGASAGWAGDKDVIGDFNPWQEDIIDLSSIHDDAGNDLTFVGFHHQGGFTAPGQVGWDNTSNGINIWINTDSDAQAEAGISVQYNGFTPDASWFHL
jgi:Ca2+-binding RTX toxin-like protein